MDGVSKPQGSLQENCNRKNTSTGTQGYTAEMPNEEGRL